VGPPTEVRAQGPGFGLRSRLRDEGTAAGDRHAPDAVPGAAGQRRRRAGDRHPPAGVPRSRAGPQRAAPAGRAPGVRGVLLFRL
jgi:hypothetical protein